MIPFKLITGLLLLLTTLSVDSANILCILPIPSPSHHIWNSVWMEALVERGHNLTVISADKDKNRENIKYYWMETIYSDLAEAGAVDYVQMSKDGAFQTVFTFLNFFESCCRSMLRSEGLKAFLKNSEHDHYDLVMYDFGVGPCLLPLLHKLNNPPLISITAFGNPPYSVDVIGGHKHYAYTPYFGLNYSTDMNFFQRAYNTFLSILESAYRNYYIIPKVDAMAREHFKYSNLPHVRDLEQRTQVMLVSTNPSMDALEPLPPNVIAIGGAHIKNPEPLPADLEDFIQKGKRGSVLFSLGSNIRSDKIGADRQKMFIEAFRQIPQYNFLWKFESNLELDLPPNVLIKSWMPQNSVLAHPKTKAFITHSGGLSTQEASWYGIPLIGMPFFMDQYKNCYQSVKAEVAEALDFQSLSTDKIRDTVLKVLETPKYWENMQRRSKFFRDQPEKPLNRTIWWVEYVLRHGDVSFMKSPSLALGAIQSNLFDVYLFYIALIYTIFKVFTIIVSRKIRKQSKLIKTD
ncbi:UDP-glucosyltransferase 2-like [Uranotaenia lowii]|uniref:UDP-glucosyltransferase 2-like n=1 Tax=Uranotaenia lowii TaxID=190385 RepID=UPI0024783994|nr:UDP-glucosyltransferase 2-like [Uranotaenia lowii]